jgi:hypothetical protein
LKLTAREILEAKARDYELNALAAADRPNDANARVEARCYWSVAVALLEVARALDVADRERSC